MKAMAISVASTLTPPIAQVVTVVRDASVVKTRGAENLIGVVDDGVDAGNLLEDRKSRARP